MTAIVGSAHAGKLQSAHRIADPAVMASRGHTAASSLARREIPVTKREIFGWAMFDFANSSYTTVIVTVAYDQIERARTVFEWGPAPKPGKGPRTPRSTGAATAPVVDTEEETS